MLLSTSFLHCGKQPSTDIPQDSLSEATSPAQTQIARPAHIGDSILHHGVIYRVLYATDTGISPSIKKMLPIAEDLKWAAVKVYCRNISGGVLIPTWGTLEALQGDDTLRFGAVHYQAGWYPQPQLTPGGSGNFTALFKLPKSRIEHLYWMPLTPDRASVTSDSFRIDLAGSR